MKGSGLSARLVWIVVRDAFDVECPVVRRGECGLEGGMPKGGLLTMGEPCCLE